MRILVEIKWWSYVREKSLVILKCGASMGIYWLRQAIFLCRGECSRESIEWERPVRVGES